MKDHFLINPRIKRKKKKIKTYIVERKEIVFMEVKAVSKQEALDNAFDPYDTKIISEKIYLSQVQ